MLRGTAAEAHLPDIGIEIMGTAFRGLPLRETAQRWVARAVTGEVTREPQSRVSKESRIVAVRHPPPATFTLITTVGNSARTSGVV